jgi:hypothetical protein
VLTKRHSLNWFTDKKMEFGFEKITFKWFHPSAQNFKQPRNFSSQALIV